MTQRRPGGLIAGLQRRLLVLLVVVLLSVVGFFIVSYVHDQQNALDRAGERLQVAARMSALGAERHVEGTRQLLNAVTSGPSLRNSGRQVLCSEFLANIRSAYPYYTNLAFLDANGHVLCHALKSDQPGSFKDRSYFTEAVNNNAFAMGNYQVGQITGVASLGFGMPVFDHAAKLKGIAYAALEISQLAMALKNSLPPGMRVTLTDRRGTILGTAPAQSPDRVGTRLADAVLGNAPQMLLGHITQALDPSGVMRLYAEASVADDTGPGMYVVTSMTRDTVTAPAWQALQLQLLLITTVALLGIWLARWIANRTLVEPTRRLVQKINAMGLDGAPTPAVGQDEILSLSSAFDRFAHLIEQRSAERDQQQKILEKMQASLLTAQRIAKIGNWELDVTTEKLWWSAQTYALFEWGADTEAPEFDRLHERVFADDLAHFEAAKQKLLAGLLLDLEVRVVLRSGKVRWFHALGEMQYDDQDRQSTCVGTVRDITDRVVNEQLLAAEAKALTALSLNMPLKSVLEEVLIGLESILPGAAASVWLVSADGKCLEIGAAPHLPAAFRDAHQSVAIGSEAAPCGVAAFGGKTMVVDDIASNPLLWARYRDSALAHGLRACWSIPLKSTDGAVIATFAAHYKQPRSSHPEELAWAHSAARVIGVAIQRDGHEAALRASEQRFRNCFQASATGMAISTLEGRFIQVNDAYSQMLGYTNQELYGMDIQAVTYAEDWPQNKVQLLELTEGRRESVISEKRYKTKLGQLFWTRISVSLLRGANGEPEGFIGLAEDINQQRQAQTEVLQLSAELEVRVQTRTAQLEAVNRELEAFSYSVSHDLRSPLNTINGFGLLLQKSNASLLTDKGKHYLERIRAGTQQMGELIEGLLSLAKLSRNALRISAVDLSAIALRVEQECREREPERQVTLHIQPGLTVHGDATLLLLVMQNLLSNAWKYTSKQTTARIEFGTQPTAGGETAYFVRDNGAGFDMAHADKLYGAFQRLHAPSDFAGTGVGLANVKRVVERHGGRVWAEGRLNEGATFFFTINNPDT